MRVLIIVFVVFLVLFYYRVSIYVKYDENFEIWLILGRFIRFRVSFAKFIRKYVNIDNIDMNLDNLIAKFKISNYLVKDLLKRIIVEKITIIEYSNILSEKFILGIPFSMYYANIIIQDNLEKYFKKVIDSYYSLNFNTIGFNQFKVELKIKMILGSIFIFIIKNFNLIFRSKLNDRVR